MNYFDRNLIVVCLILSVSDGINGWYPCQAHTLRHILWVFHTIITPQSTAHPVEIVHTICRAIGMPTSVDMGWSMLHNWPYHKRGRLGGIHALRLSLTCLSPRDFVNACALLTVYRYTSQEGAYKKRQTSTGMWWSSTCIHHDRRRKSHRHT